MFAETARGHECETAAPALRETIGCDKPADVRVEFEGLKIDRCPAYYEREAGDMSFLFQAYNWREKGFLPYEGPWTAQPHKIVEACDFLDRLFSFKMRMEMNRGEV